MTVLAVVIACVWMAGIPAVAAGLWHLSKDDPWMNAAFTVNTEAACLITAIAAVCWPVALPLAALLSLVQRGAK
ncbi:hypothetical protein [Streptomyces sp. NPDC053560]|uniref:hypothetical protein n=1 Tax=Streptomyces sp. NPDC053560 TaxID=3365711 RepID=UPI0037CF170D